MATLLKNQEQAEQSRLDALKQRIQPLLDFWQKLNNDWVFNLSGMLAYNFLMSIFPILLVLIAVAGFVLGAISPETQAQLDNAIVGALPGNTGKFIVESLETRLRESAGLVFAIGLITAFWSGSRLFTTLEGTFGVIYRLRGRDFLHQNIMAIGMLLLYIVLVPIVVLASAVPTAIVHLVLPDESGFRGVLVFIIGIAVGLVAACLLFGATYVVVPNRPVRWNEVWKGTLVAAVLLVLYEQLFPFYSSNFLKPDNYGSIAGFAVVILVFFYYMGFILLLGSEVNSWAEGQRQTAGDIPAILHEVQAHGTTRGAAGPTAGDKAEDLQHHKGAQAMSSPSRAIEHERSDHDTNIQPPKYAEADNPGPEEARTPSPAESWRTNQAKRAHDGTPPDDAEDHDERDEKRDEKDAHVTEKRAQRAEPAHASVAVSTTMSASERASRKRKTFGSLALTTGAALASLFLLARRRGGATS